MAALPQQGASPALAARVTGPGPWKATNTYQAQADLNGRVAPRVAAPGQVNHVRKGQWIFITCQVIGDEAYGSKVWIKTKRGQYVPDRYVKTYTDGLLKGVPTCGATQPQPGPTGPAAAGPSRNELYAVASAVAFEGVGGPLYKRYKAAYPAPMLSWSTNGCSVPSGVPNGKKYSAFFRASCDRHDFGYRNFGKGQKFNPTNEMRARLDRQLSDNMDQQCKDADLNWFAEKGCFRVSGIFYRFVRAFGGSRLTG